MRIPVTLTAIGVALGIVALANAQVYKPGGSGSGSFPPSGCATANGVIFNNATPCDAGLTYSGGGTNAVVTIGNTIQFAGANPGLIKAQAAGAITIFAADVSFVTANGSGTFSLFPTSTNGVGYWTDNTGSAFSGRMGFGGSTSSFPALGRSTTQLQVVLADGSAAAPLSAGVISASLASATGTSVVCNNPGTTTALTVQVSATGCAASSARLKEGIASIDREKALDTVMAFEPVAYTYKKKYANDPDMHIGFTAEQVDSIPSPVAGYKLTTKENVVIFRPHIVANSKLLHAVKYNEMAPLFAAAIQALKADNDNLRAELEDLKRRVR